MSSFNSSFESTTGWLLYLLGSFLMQYRAVGHPLFTLVDTHKNSVWYTFFNYTALQLAKNYEQITNNKDIHSTFMKE